MDYPKTDEVEACNVVPAARSAGSVKIANGARPLSYGQSFACDKVRVELSSLAVPTLRARSSHS
jgi:hypothetical protein